MRVLHVIPSAAPEDGGPNEAVRAMARGLARGGWDVTVATTRAVGSAAVAAEEEGVVFRYFPRTVPGSWKFSWPLTRWLWHNARVYDVVHVHALFSYATIPGCRSAARVPVPYVLRPLGTLSEWSLAHRAWKKRPYLALIERGHLAAASAIHVTSDAEANDVRRLGYGDRVAVIPLGVELPERKARGPHDGEPLHVVFLSRLHPKKNVPLLLRAFARARREASSVRLTIAGHGEPGYERELARLAGSLGLDGFVRFAGRVDAGEKARLLADAHCFVLPSAHENFGIAVAEALAAGLPVIVSPGVALASDVRAAGAGLVVPAEEGTLAAALIRAARHPAELRAMAARARALARDRLSWDRSCGQLAELYRSLAGTRRLPARAPAVRPA